LEDKFSALFRALRSHGISVEADVRMDEKTSFKIGGAAELVILPETAAQLETALRLCESHGELPFLLGRGSNLLVKDSGLDRAVIATENLCGIALLDETTIECQAGVKLSDLCLFALQNGLTGLEFAYGIPGSVGGAVFMNAGAYGGEVNHVLQSVDCFLPGGIRKTIAGADCALAYRHSVFMETPGAAVFSAVFALQKGNSDEIRAKMDNIIGRRKAKQPLEYPSAGSVFKRPPGQFAGQLIDQCGLKGKSIGGAQVSEKHAGFIVNKGGATAADVRTLIVLVQTVVEQETGFFLQPEIQFV
jgi:UDP-N-acetylmuramate dehydrogenase